jgi:hypothetical protein
MKNERRLVFKKRFDQRVPLISEGVRREICRRRATGQSMKEITADPDLPNQDLIYDLMWRDESFKKMYKAARMAYTEKIAEELRDKAAEARDFKGDPKGHMAHVQAVRLEVDTDKWLLSKLLAEEYGDELPNQQRGKAVSDLMSVIQSVAQLAWDNKPEPAKTEPAKAVVVESKLLEDKAK